MKRHTACLMVMFFAAAVISGPSFNISASVGGVSSYSEALGSDSFNIAPGFYIKSNGLKFNNYFSFGIAGEVEFNEYFGLDLGVTYEKHGGTLTGDVFWGSLKIGSGQWEIDYRYLQIPVLLKITLPLMIPGSVFCAVGPELGILLESEQTWRTDQANPNFPRTEKIDTLTEPFDFGLSAAAGYDIPIGWSLGVRLQVGYYYGFIDVNKKGNPVNSDANIYNRAIKYGISVYYNFSAARR